MILDLFSTWHHWFWCLQGIKFSSDISFDSFVAHTKCTDMFDAVFHRSPLHALVSNYTLTLLLEFRPYTTVNGSDLLLQSETCLKCGGFLTRACLHSVNTFWAVQPGPCCKWAEVLGCITVKWNWRVIPGEFMLLSSLYIKFGDLSPQSMS